MRAVRFFDGASSLTLILASRWIRSSLAGRVQCREHPCGGGLVGAQQNHQHIDEKAFAVRPAADQMSHQCENEAGTAAAGMSKSGLEAACRHTWQKCPHLQAGQFDRTPSSPRKYIERYSSRLGECCSAITTGKMALSGYFLAGVPLFSTTSCHTRASWHSVGTRVNFYAQLRCK
jgi:hypothetical protein